MAVNNNPIFQEYVSPEEVNALPLTYYNGKIILITKASDVLTAVEEISKFPVVGFDTETKPTFVKGQFCHISLIQLAIPGKVFLFRINHAGLTQPLIDLFSNENILKVGVGLRDDIIGLQKIHPFEAAGFEEIHKYVVDLGVRNTGLRKLAAILMKVRISKGQQTSNWENTILTKNQQSYAATDAWICLEMYNLLEEKGFVYQ